MHTNCENSDKKSLLLSLEIHFILCFDYEAVTEFGGTPVSFTDKIGKMVFFPLPKQYPVTLECVPLLSNFQQVNPLR